MQDPLLEKDDPENPAATRSLQAEDGITLSWVDLNCWVETPKEKEGEKAAGDEAGAPAPQPPPLPKEAKAENMKLVLDKVSGFVKPGSMLAIMGPSGSGKTTMLNLLGGREQLGKNGLWKGKVALNGIDRKTVKNWQRRLGFVLQKDVFYGNPCPCLPSQGEFDRVRHDCSPSQTRSRYRMSSTSPQRYACLGVLRRKTAQHG